MSDAGKVLARRSQRGFTVVEVIIAVIVLAVGILGMAGTTAHIVRQVTYAEATSKRARALQSVIERVRAAGYDSVAYGSDGSGTEAIGSFAVAWTSAASSARSVLVTIITTGPGLAPVSGSLPVMSNAVTDTFTYRLIRP